MALFRACALVHNVRHLTAHSYLCRCNDCVDVLIREGGDAPHALQLLVRSDKDVVVVTAAHASDLVSESGDLGVLAPRPGDLLRYVAVMADPVLQPPRNWLAARRHEACCPATAIVLRGR